MSASRAFSKYVGAGNDFLFFDARDEPFRRPPRSALAARLCDRHFGLGADGAVFVERSVKAGVDLRWDFFNSDGSSAEMCGNAARCLVRWAHDRLGLATVSFETQAGVVTGAVSGAAPETIMVELPFVAREARKLSVDLGPGRTATPVWLFDTGVPHAVLEVPAIAEARTDPAAVKRLRGLVEAGPRGANVTFFSRADGAGRIESVTFERGVEGFTLACGTGVIASALAALDGGSGAQAAVTVPGGTLDVSFEGARPGVVLSGPADFVYEGEFAGGFLR